MKKNKGITLIALVVTIVVLMILASISIGMLTGENGIINKTKSAKEETESAEEKEKVEISAVQAAEKDVYGEINEKNLANALDKNIGDRNVKYVLTIEADKFKVTYIESGRCYYVYKDGKVEFIKEEIKEPIVVAEIIGDFVEYNIPYTDVYYDTYKYTAQNGWRIMNAIEQTGNPGYYDIEIISTGIPAGLYYDYTHIKEIENDKTDETTKGKWAGNSEQRTKYAEKFYASSSNDNYNMYAVAGLYNNFEKIVFKKETGQEAFDNNHYNYGYYTNINGKTEEEIEGKELFRDSAITKKIKGVREVTLADIRGDNKSEDTTTIPSLTGEADSGLFRLDNLSSVKNATDRGVNNYSYNTGWYWLTSPYSGGTNAIRGVKHDGFNNYWDIYHCYLGVRPVVSITGVQLENKNGIWKIK